MNIFVINLEKDVERRASISRQLEQLGLGYEIVEGVYGAELSKDELKDNYSDRKAKWRVARSLVSAEIGCALSHIKVYREIVEQGLSFTLILEDDVILPPELDVLLADCAKVVDPRRPEVWLLSPAVGDQEATRARLLPSGQLVLPYKDGFYASSYLVTASAAKALIAELYPVGDVADCWRRMNRYQVVELFVVSPTVIQQNQDAFGSSTTTGYHQVYRNELFGRLIYKARRTRAILWEFFYSPYRKWRKHYTGIKSSAH